MRRSIVPCLWVVALALVSLDASADAMCGGPRRRPEPPPPQPSNSGFATPPPQGALDPSGDARTASRRPVMPVELGMLGGMVLLGSAAGLASRGKKKQP